MRVQSTERLQSGDVEEPVEVVEQPVEEPAEEPVEKPVEDSTNEPVNEPVNEPAKDSLNDPSVTQPANPGKEIKRRASPGEEAEQLSKLLSHAVSQQFIVLRRLRKVLDTVRLSPASHPQMEKEAVVTVRDCEQRSEEHSQEKTTLKGRSSARSQPQTR